MHVAVGSVNRKEGDKYEIEKFVPHENYKDDTIMNDIALVKVKKPIQFSKTVQPIKIREERVGGEEGVTVTGWGSATYNGDAPDILQFLTLKTITNDECKQMHSAEEAALIYPFSLCTFGKKKEGTCGGDSGGPLALKGELVGIVSWGVPCADGFPDVYTRVSEYTKWVNDHMAKK